MTGDTVKRASMASVLCKIAGKQIPIHPGRRESLLIEQKQPDVPQAVALDRWAHNTDFSQGEAVEFMRQTIRSRPGEVVLLGIGPMTNIAALFAADEEIPRLLKGLVVMCGAFLDSTSKTEWNALVDPAAAAIMYRAQPPYHRSVGLDVTLKVTMPADEVRKKFQTPLLRPVLDFAEVWFQRTTEITFHDPLAAATLFDEAICGFEPGRIAVELKSDHVPGATLWYPNDAAGHHQIATTVNAPRFFEHYFSFFK